MSISPSRQQLRHDLRHARRALTKAQLELHSLAMAKQLTASPLFRSARRIAAYIAADGEMDPVFVIDQAWSMGKAVYLPVLSPFQSRLHFAPFTPDTTMVLNRFGIPEPDIHPRHYINAHQLSLILMPLVGFDAQRNRMGMGGGFYDRSLAFSKYRPAPRLVGLAHECQRVDALPCESWDIPLHRVITERQQY